jgi:hypothetical protein
LNNTGLESAFATQRLLMTVWWCWITDCSAEVKPEVLVLDVMQLEHLQHTAAVLDRAMRTRDMDNERFLRKVRARLDACASHIITRPPQSLPVCVSSGFVRLDVCLACHRQQLMPWLLVAMEHPVVVPALAALQFIRPLSIAMHVLEARGGAGHHFSAPAFMQNGLSCKMACALVN